ncbi:MAG: methyltransferase domain-containing protein [Solirubrobacteraceae bacterium]
MSGAPAGRSPVRRPLFARAYAVLSPRAEGRGIADHRRELLGGLSGRVLEVGCGNGLNFGHYPTAVTAVLALEPEPYLRGLAIEAARIAPVPVTVVDAPGEAIPAVNGSFDHAVAALVLCSVGEPERVLAELHRVLVPGGTLHYYEHVAAHGRPLASVQRLMDATLWPRLAGGCHLSRDTGAAIRAAGFTIVSEHPLAAISGSLGAIAPHVLGVATRA